MKTDIPGVLSFKQKLVRKGHYDLIDADGKHVGELLAPEVTGAETWKFRLSVYGEADSCEEAYGQAASLYHASREGR